MYLVQKMLWLCATKNGPKLMNRCKPEKVSAKAYGNILKRIQVLEDGRIPAKKARKREN